MEPIRINKYLRDKGIASRREADDLIEHGKVYVNGKKAAPGLLIKEGDEVSLKEGWEKEYIYLAYNKPVGLSTQGQKGEVSVVSQWKSKGLFPVGRLDKESEGLLILTNDGRVTDKLLGPNNHFEKEYVIQVKERVREGIPAIFKKGMDTKSLGKLRPAEGKVTGEHTMQVILHEGKRHQIRVMFAELGYTIQILKRIRIGRIRLSNLKPGAVRALTPQEVALILG